MSKLVLLDSHAILHRAYHALPPLTSPNGTAINAVYGYTTMLLTILETLKPTHLIAAFDMEAPNFRQQFYTAYQGKRPEMQGNLKEQIPLVRGMLDALKIVQFGVSGFEADDVIGTLARKAVGSWELGVGSREKNNTTPNHKLRTTNPEVVIITGDRDMLQLVNDSVKVCVPVKGLSQTKTYNEKLMVEEFGVKPSQWVDVKALKGDASDNYSGVLGVGPKTAEKLIQRYDNLENLYAHLDELEPKLKLKLANGVEEAGLAKKLATIVTEVPGVKFKGGECELENIDWKSGIDFMRANFGFKTIVGRIEKLYLTRKSEVRSKNNTEKGEQMSLV